MDRRTLMTGAALLTGSSAASFSAHAMSAPTGRKMPKNALSSGMLDGPLVNQARAQEVMEKYDLQGLIALRMENVFYFTNTQPLLGKMGSDYTAFATYPRDPDQTSFLVVSLSQAWDLANKDRWTPELIAFSGPANGADYRGPNAKALSEEPIAGKFRYTFGEDADLSAIEQQWRDIGERLNPAASAEWALARALKESGITRGRVAVDDMRIAYLLQKIGQAEAIEFVDGADVFRDIRYRKSEREIALMRLAATNNAEAVMATAAQIEQGMTNADLETLFLSEAGQRGNEFIFLLAGFATGGLADGEIRKDRPFLIDAVSEFSFYNGDFARTFTLDALPKSGEQMMMAQRAAREELYSKLRPGMTFSEIRKIGKETFRKAGGNADAFFVSPHSVGLEHADHPRDVNDPWRGGQDITLEAGVTMTIDLPYMEFGNLSGHHEDVILITETGFERLTPDYPDVVYI